MKRLLFILFSLTLFINSAFAEECVKIVQLKYISPSELIESLDMIKNSPDGYKLGVNGNVAFIRINSANNQLLISSDSTVINKAIDLINFMDVAARQIIIEAKIVEIDNQKIRETGLDWQSLLNSANVSINYQSNKYIRENETIREDQDPIKQENKQTDSDRRLSGNIGNINIGKILKIIEDNNVGTVTNVPKIVTTNNKMGKILDGDRITYVTRYSSYTNLYETQELTAGLSLQVTPSLGESGYLKLDVQAKYTTLGEIIGDSPSESGQILENTVIAKNKESFLLGAFQQTEIRKIKRKVPLLGSILPFLFSRDVKIEITKDILIILTPEIIDLNPTEIPNIQATKV